MIPKELSIVYSSDLMIWDQAYLSTLCVFYDRVYLPSTSPSTHKELMVFCEKPGASEYELTGVNVYMATTTDDYGQPVSLEGGLSDWEKRNKALFQEGVLLRLPAWKADPVELLFEPDRPIPSNQHQAPETLQVPVIAYGSIEGRPSIHMRQDYVMHLLRTDLPAPSVFVSEEFRRETVKSVLAHRTLRFFLPKLGELQPEQVLKVREAVAPNREGFSMHLQVLTKEIESRLKGGESLDEVIRYADSVVETKLIPDYLEFRRQLGARKGGYWSNVLDKLGRVAEIDAAPWTPKFYGDLIKALGLTLLTGISEEKEDLTNRNQACHFMRTVERFNIR